MKNRVLLWETQLATWLRRTFSPREEAGASLVEYVLLVTLIAVAAVGALIVLGHTVNNTLGNDINQINNGVTTTATTAP